MDRDHDRPRPPTTPSAGLPSARPGVATAALLVVLVSALLVYVAAGRPPLMERALGLSPELAFRQPWRLLAWTLLHAGAMGALLDLLTLWLFGTAVESRLGRWRMVGTFVAGQLLGGLAAAAVGTAVDPGRVLVGSAAGGLALVMAFGTSCGAQPLMVFGVARMSARTLALLLSGLALLGPLLHADWIGLTALAAGGLTGMVYGGHLPDRLRQRREQRRVQRLRSRYRVLPGGQV